MKFLKWLLLPYMAAVIVGAFLWPAPAQGFIGESSRIVFFHVPCAWTGALAFLVAAGYSVAYLARRRPEHDDVAGPAVLREPLAEQPPCLGPVAEPPAVRHRV